MAEKTEGLTCPNCTGVVPVPEGVRIVTCPSCDQRSLVQGERGVRRWQVSRKVEREQAINKIKEFFSGLKKASDLAKTAKIKELFLVYIPYWRVTATTAGWMFGRVKVDEDKSKPVEVRVMEEMHWNDAATDISEFGVQRVQVDKTDLEPYDQELLHREAMVFEPTESRTEAVAESEKHFTYRARKKKKIEKRFFEKFHFFRSRLSMVYYPLWVARYEYKGRNYQVVIDGVRNRVLYGKAPGNTLYRAAALVFGMALGNFVLVNGTIIGGSVLLFSSSDNNNNGFMFILVPVVVGIGLALTGYRTFRYGEEVEEIDGEAKKAKMAGGKESEGWLTTTIEFIDEMTEELR